MLFKHWIISQDEKVTNPDIMVFRPAGQLGTSRAIRSIDIHQNGEIVFYQPGPDDRPTKITGQFTFEENNMKVLVKDKKPLFIKIIKLENDVLHISISKD